MPFSPGTKKDAFTASKARCAICHEYPIMNYHHINPEAQSQDNSYNNCLPVCSNCHDFIMIGEITRENQIIIRDTWYRLVDWKSTDDEKKLLESSYQEETTIERIDENLIGMKTQFEEFIGEITNRKDSKEVANKASHLVTSILTTGSYYTLLQIDKGEFVSGFPCPLCDNLIEFQYVDGRIIRCPKCHGSLEPFLVKEK